MAYTARTFKLLPASTFRHRRSFTSTEALPKPVELSYHHLPVDSPSGPPLVILHGLLGFKRNWQSLSKAFQRTLNRHIYTLDLRNHGSSPHQEPMTYSAMANDILHFCEKHSLQSISLLGHSMGGKVAMSVALNKMRPKGLITELVVADISPAKGPLSQEFTGYIKGMREIEEKRVTSRREADVLLKPYEPDGLTRAFLLSNLLPSSDGREPLRFQIPLEIISRDLAEIGSFPYETGEAQWDGRTLFIKGVKSKYINDKTIPLARQFFPNMQLQHLHAGHWVHSERPNEFLGVVSKFILENPNKDH